MGSNDAVWDSPGAFEDSPMPKQKRHKGLLKRIRLTKSGKVRFRAAYSGHRRSHKSGKLRRSYRVPRFAQSADMKRLRSLLGLSTPKPDRKSDAAQETGASTSDT